MRLAHYQLLYLHSTVRAQIFESLPIAVFPYSTINPLIDDDVEGFQHVALQAPKAVPLVGAVWHQLLKGAALPAGPNPEGSSPTSGPNCQDHVPCSFDDNPIQYLQLEHPAAAVAIVRIELSSKEFVIVAR